MIKVNIAGTGCILGKGIVYVQRMLSDDEYIFIKTIDSITDRDIANTIVDLLKTIDIQKDEIVSLGSLHYTIANRVSNEFKGYKDKGLFRLGNSTEEDKIKAHNAFMERLYTLGVRRSVRLWHNDFKKFNTDLIYEIARTPYLKDYIKPERKTEKVMDMIYKIENFVIDLLENDTLDVPNDDISDPNIL